MSRFSRSEAEARGWVITHNEIDGELREVRADLYAGPGNTISFEQPSEGLLLEAISSYEAKKENESFGPERQEVIEPEITNVDDEGNPIRDVQTPEGIFASEELFPAGEGDIEGGVMKIADPDVVAARESSAQLSRDAEAIRTEDPQADAEEQNVIIYDESGNVSDVRQVRVEDGGGTIKEILERRDPENSALEQARVADSDAGHFAEGEAPPEPQDVEVDATDAAKQLAEDAGIDLASIAVGTGKDGRITKPDVEALMEPDAEDEPEDD